MTHQSDSPRPVVLLILDGIGWGRRDDGDAVFLASTPHIDALQSRFGWGLLQAHGTAVGMPGDDDMGNSEVGHNAMGAGRIFDQGAKLVNRAIETGAIWEGAAWREAVARARAGGTLHLLGLVSDGNVHSHVDHLRAMIDRAVVDGVRRLRVHGLTDGRDVGKRTALRWFGPLDDSLRALSTDGRDYAFATGGGRMHMTMDRYEADWAMVKRGWDCHVHAVGRRFPTVTDAIETLYAEDPSIDDQWLPAFVIDGYDGMHDGDAVLLFNFRGDRAIEISRAFTEPDFRAFDRSGPDGRPPPEVSFAGMMEYDGDLHVPPSFLVAPPVITGTVGDHLAAAGKTVYVVSETQKFGHVTYFFNGNRSDPPRGEERAEVPSLQVPFDQAPAMSADAVTQHAAAAIRSGRYDHVRINLANGDMVGHTGVLDATVTAVGVVDRCVGAIVDATFDAGGVLVLTADHGNADEMFRVDRKRGTYALGPDGQRIVSTSHSLNPVPVVVADPSGRWRLRDPAPDRPMGSIARIGGTLLDLLGLPVPPDYLDSLVRPAARP
ncbi:MAG: 2,3-bisphosphoglycerate-independent phosphoglycerate mutase [Deltaproteobacteria bacterium]|nr:MAG: 2,3-bisphosphoglycerate-independent phosphoglycerate mutase [Deltaproteobacteria bacterium]